MYCLFRNHIQIFDTYVPMLQRQLLRNIFLSRNYFKDKSIGFGAFNAYCNDLLSWNASVVNTYLFKIKSILIKSIILTLQKMTQTGYAQIELAQSGFLTIFLQQINASDDKSGSFCVIYDSMPTYVPWYNQYRNCSFRNFRDWGGGYFFVHFVLYLHLTKATKIQKNSFSILKSNSFKRYPTRYKK